ncbi:uncharacterized protein LOC144712191 isoform X2 [Wolffia australiana]
MARLRDVDLSEEFGDCKFSAEECLSSCSISNSESLVEEKRSRPNHRSNLTYDVYPVNFRAREPSECSLSPSAALSSTDPRPARVDRRSGVVFSAPEISFLFSSSQGSDQSATSSRRTDIADLTEKGIRDLSELQVPANTRRSARTKNQTRFTNRASTYHLSNGLHSPIEWENGEQFKYGEENPCRLTHNATHFHFSIHKWTNTEMSLIMPYNLLNKGKSSRRLYEGSAQNLQEGKILPTLRKEHLKSKSGGLCVDGDSDARLLKHETKKFSSFSAAKYDKYDFHRNPDRGSRNWKSKQDKPGGVKDVKGLQEIKRKSFFNSFVGKQKGTDNNANVELEISDNSEAIQELQPLVRRLNKNVKEFIKIFSNEASQQRKSKFGIPPRNPITRNQDSEVEDKAINDNSPALSEGGHCPMKTAEPVSINNTNSRNEDDYILEAPGTPVRPSGSADSFFSRIDEYFESVDECLAEKFSQIENEPSEAELYCEIIQASDVKIRDWSKGKEGNIRSLLSTLQYVLWPESGWKPVPLVDIIEGHSVRRAYQKAMLCLHPDKLQQKGADVHQRNVAEKVFNILQDAWTNFSSLSSP